MALTFGFEFKVSDCESGENVCQSVRRCEAVGGEIHPEREEETYRRCHPVIMQNWVGYAVRYELCGEAYIMVCNGTVGAV